MKKKKMEKRRDAQSWMAMGIKRWVEIIGASQLAKDCHSFDQTMLLLFFRLLRYIIGILTRKSAT